MRITDKTNRNKYIETQSKKKQLLAQKQKRNRIRKLNKILPSALRIGEKEEKIEEKQIKEFLNSNIVDTEKNEKNGNSFDNLKNKFIIPSSIFKTKNKKNRNITFQNTENKKNKIIEIDDEDIIREKNREKINVFDTSPVTIPSLSRPAIALKKKNNENIEYLKINSIEIKPKSLNFDNENDNDNENEIIYFPNEIEIKKTIAREKRRKNEMLSRRQSSIIFRVQIIQNEIINNLNLRKQLYYYGNKAINMNDMKLSQLDKNSITKETKRRINELSKINEILKRKRYECYFNFNSKFDFSDFGYYRNFFFFVGDFSDAFWNEVKKIIKSGDEKPDYAITRLARSGVEGKFLFIFLFSVIFDNIHVIVFLIFFVFLLIPYTLFILFYFLFFISLYLFSLFFVLFLCIYFFYFLFFV